MKIFLDALSKRIHSWLGLDFDIDMQDELFSLVTPGLYLGSCPTPQHIEALEKEGITHIVSCLSIERRTKVSFLETKFKTLFLPLNDNINEDISASLSAFFNFVSDAQKHSPTARILVHCEVGVSRSATLVLALLMKIERKRFIDVFNELRLKRAKVLPNIGFASQLQHIEHEYCLDNQTAPKVSSLAQYLHQICNVPVDIDVLQTVLEAHDYNALIAIQTIFGKEIPRVIQGVR